MYVVKSQASFSLHGWRPASRGAQGQRGDLDLTLLLPVFVGGEGLSRDKVPPDPRRHIGK